MKKIKLFGPRAKKYWISGAIVAAIALPASLIAVSLTVGKRDFVLANYQSYMSPTVQKELKNKYGVSFDSFENVEGAKKLITSNSADIVNTTTYEVVNWSKEGIIQKLDWTKFNLPGITTAQDALSLFTPSVQAILQAYDLNGNGVMHEVDDNLLNYGIPYFLQDLVFAYRGNEIPELSGNVTWKQTIDAIVKDERFHSTNQPHLIGLDDPRTIYSIPKAMQDNDINPPQGASASDLIDTYTILRNELNQLGHLPIKLNSDSVTVLNSVADGKDIKGGFMFNGDAIYAASGGDNGVIDPNVGFHIVKPTDNAVALDMMVLNKNLGGDNLNKAYDLLKDLSLTFDNANPEQSITYQNFDNVNYTTPLKDLYDYIISSDYFESDETKTNAFEIDVSSSNVLHKVELPIDDLTKSNFSFAWIDFKAHLN